MSRSSKTAIFGLKNSKFRPKTVNFCKDDTGYITQQKTKNQKGDIT